MNKILYDDMSKYRLFPRNKVAILRFNILVKFHNYFAVFRLFTKHMYFAMNGCSSE